MPRQRLPLRRGQPLESPCFSNTYAVPSAAGPALAPALRWSPYCSMDSSSTFFEKGLRHDKSPSSVPPGPPGDDPPRGGPDPRPSPVPPRICRRRGGPARRRTRDRGRRVAPPARARVHGAGAPRGGLPGQAPAVRDGCRVLPAQGRRAGELPARDHRRGDPPRLLLRRRRWAV